MKPSTLALHRLEPNGIQPLEEVSSLVRESARMYLKVHSTPDGEVVAICDAVLIGKILSQGKRRLDLEKYSGFYVGEKVAAASAIAVLRSAANANIVGEKSLEAAKTAGLDVSGAIKIGGVPHLQLYRI